MIENNPIVKEYTCLMARAHDYLRDLEAQLASVPLALASIS